MKGHNFYLYKLYVWDEAQDLGNGKCCTVNLHGNENVFEYETVTIQGKEYHFLKRDSMTAEEKLQNLPEHVKREMVKKLSE